MKNQFQVCLIGLGKMGNYHYKALKENQNFVVTNIVDPAKAGDLLGDLTVKKSLNEIAFNSFDVAIVASATPTHYSISKELLLAGKPVLVEKPAATSETEARQLCELASKNSVAFAVGHIERCNPVVSALQSVLNSGVIGAPLHASGERLGGYPAQIIGGNQVILDLAVHELDVFQSLFGDFQIATGTYHCSRYENVPDLADIQLRWTDGLFGSIQVNWLTPQKVRKLRITGELGVATVDYISQRCCVYGDKLNLENLSVDFQHIEDPFTKAIQLEVESGQPLQRQLSEWHKMISGRAHNLCTGDSLVESVARLSSCLQISQAAPLPATIQLQHH